MWSSALLLFRLQLICENFTAVGCTAERERTAFYNDAHVFNRLFTHSHRCVSHFFLPARFLCISHFTVVSSICFMQRFHCLKVTNSQMYLRRENWCTRHGKFITHHISSLYVYLLAVVTRTLCMRVYAPCMPKTMPNISRSTKKFFIW